MKQLRVFLSSRFSENNFLELREKIYDAMVKKFSPIGINVIALEKKNMINLLKHYPKKIKIF